ncbi:hypothetical protein ANN_23824 [Periplaneta americana]|uniref:Uncharacterized protein n=1 Tax=Periplaneta americana TaxID=6978 RepID=A0ABQ8SNE3_PERAM|nr:hypothetical protein ANN_23824 [Periplaneta americana]
MTTYLSRGPSSAARSRLYIQSSKPRRQTEMVMKEGKCNYDDEMNLRSNAESYPAILLHFTERISEKTSTRMKYLLCRTVKDCLHVETRITALFISHSTRPTQHYRPCVLNFMRFCAQDRSLIITHIQQIFPRKRKDLSNSPATSLSQQKRLGEPGCDITKWMHSSLLEIIGKADLNNFKGKIVSWPVIEHDDEIEIKQANQAKYLGTIITKAEGIGEEEIKNRIEQSKKIVTCLDSIWWDKHLWKDTNKYIGKMLVESVLNYGSEIWVTNAYYRKRILALEMDYLRRSARVSRLDHIKNEEIRHRMDAEETVLKRIENKSLKWFGHLMRMGEDRWPKQIYQWKPP